MWDKLLTKWNGIWMFIPSASSSSPQVVIDVAASTSFVAIFGHFWFAGPWPPQILTIPGFSQSSSLFELYHIVAAAQVWGSTWAGQTVTFATDNQATASIINKGRPKSLAIMSFLCRLVQLSLQHQSNVLCVYIPDKCNTSPDELSRFNFATFFSLDSGLNRHLHDATCLINLSLSPNTLKAYRTAWKTYDSFLASNPGAVSQPYPGLHIILPHAVDTISQYN